MVLEYRFDESCSVKEVQDVFISSGIRRPVGDTNRIQKMIKHADEIITARADGKVVGFLRAITDYAYCCYISDIAVDKEYQGLGIGKQLIKMLRHRVGEEEIQYILTTAPKAVGFYEKIGFEKADKAFVIKRKIH
ncbi:GNAT family N-acetyltransferase [Paenibacillus radicis (ex Xue et al. 2023)]|uniref:GNAT family N-acetyltransferase n=1 Tax=Paenibacillus radicis (ex Xue et al. 2023) TaxID=2972489 RepID=A0ABT1YE51_9BACL|nr:GNAT family N-acetyltransferase [Paenibacillus radicis (ex Xue et al. 2023)]MCR8630493.1 GNAT family N-acetyltransferase [Paenibacillus radicis (ex Xue et al. 2023)]